MLIRPCLGCGNVPCDGTHMRCDVEIYAQHRGLTVQQVMQQARFKAREEQAWYQRGFRLWAEPPE